MMLELEPTPLAGLMIVRSQPHVDERGSFTRLFCEATFATAGIDFQPMQMSASFNPLPHTLRGLHWQAEPHGETKLVRVSRGRAYDVAVDVRTESSTRGQWFACDLAADNCIGLLIPPGFAHGYLTLAPATELTYLMDQAHAPDAALGARFDDPAFGIEWPAPPALIGTRDQAWPEWKA